MTEISGKAASATSKSNFGGPAGGSALKGPRPQWPPMSNFGRGEITKKEVGVLVKGMQTSQMRVLRRILFWVGFVFVRGQRYFNLIDFGYWLRARDRFFNMFKCCFLWHADSKASSLFHSMFSWAGVIDSFSRCGNFILGNYTFT